MILPLSAIWGGVAFNPITTLVGTVYAGAGKWSGGALGNDDNIYGAPFDNGQVLKIDTSNDTTSLIGTAYAGGAKWIGGVAFNEFIYFAPFINSSILKLNTTTGITSLIPTAGGLYAGAAVGGNGCIYFAPYRNGRVMKLDPSTDTISLLGADTFPVGTNYWGAVTAENGNVYFIPVDATQVLKVDTSTDVTSLIGTAYAGGGKWIHGGLHSNGKIYGGRYTASQYLVIDPSTDTTSLTGTPAAGFKSVGAKEGGNNKIYSVQRGFNQAYELDVSSGISAPFGIAIAGSLPFDDCIATADKSAIYGIPRDFTQVLKIG